MMTLVDGAQLRAARALLNLGKEEFAAVVGIASNTLRRLEEMEGHLTAHRSTLRAIEAELAKRGIELIDGDAPGARLRRAGA